MHRTNGRNIQNSHRLCRHAPQSAATAPATCCEGNAAPCTRPHLSIRLMSAVNGPPARSPCHMPANVNHGRTVDRKSTRLNSSHLGISYAVFCLKKKNLATPTYPTCPKPSSTTTGCTDHPL